MDKDELTRRAADMCDMAMDQAESHGFGAAEPAMKAAGDAVEAATNAGATPAEIRQLTRR